MATIDSVHEFTDSWRWPEDVERFVRDQLPTGRVLNVPAGKSPLGDVKLDIDPTLQRDDRLVQGDMYQLPFQDATFDGVVADPPWKSVDVFDRHSLFYELVRVTKPDGVIVHNATWVPESNQATKISEFRRADDPFRDASVIAVYRRLDGQQTFDAYGDDEPVVVDEDRTKLTLTTNGRGWMARGQLALSGPEGRLVAHKEYAGPLLSDTADGGEQAPSGGGPVVCSERVHYEFPDAPDPERVQKHVPERRGEVRLPRVAVQSGTPSSIKHGLGPWFRDDPTREYQIVHRRIHGAAD